MKGVAGVIETLYKNTKAAIVSPEETSQFREATLCHICNQLLGNDRVLDHCHLTGKIILNF